MPRIRTAGKWMAAVTFAAIVVLWLVTYRFQIGLFWVFLAMFWHVLPVAGALACVRASNTIAGAIGFFVLEAAFALWTILLLIDSSLSRSRLWGQSLLFDLYLFPAVLLGALLAVLALALVVGWRPREGWRQD